MNKFQTIVDSFTNEVNNFESEEAEQLTNLKREAKDWLNANGGHRSDFTIEIDPNTKNMVFKLPVITTSTGTETVPPTALAGSKQLYFPVKIKQPDSEEIDWNIYWV